VTVAHSVVHQFYAALARGEAETALALLDPEVSWTEAEHSPYYKGEVIGVEAVVETVLNPINHDFEDFRVIALDFVSEEDRVAVFGRYAGRHRASRKELQATFVHSWTIRGDLLARFEQYTDTTAWEKAVQSRSSPGSVRSAFF